MLVIVCGEDTAASRDYFHTLQKDYESKGFYLAPVEPADLQTILKEEQGTVTLFNEKKVYFMNNLTRMISRKTSSDFKDLLKNTAQNPDLILLDWEGNKSAREITLKEAQIKEFKLPRSIFQLLDGVYPGNLTSFLRLFSTLCEDLEPEFIFAMLSRHTRQLLLAGQNGLPSTLPPWQKAKLYSQASRWSEADLLAFYEGLARIDQNLKTGKDTLGVRKAIDILACFCLR